MGSTRKESGIAGQSAHKHHRGRFLKRAIPITSISVSIIVAAAGGVSLILSSPPAFAFSFKRDYHDGYTLRYLLVSSVALVSNSDSCSLEGLVCLKNSTFIPSKRSWAYKSSSEFVIL
jgi:hypothetical protein